MQARRTLQLDTVIALKCLNSGARVYEGSSHLRSNCVTRLRVSKAGVGLTGILVTYEQDCHVSIMHFRVR